MTHFNAFSAVKSPRHILVAKLAKAQAKGDTARQIALLDEIRAIRIY